MTMWLTSQKSIREILPESSPQYTNIHFFCPWDRFWNLITAFHPINCFWTCKCHETVSRFLTWASQFRHIHFLLSSIPHSAFPISPFRQKTHFAYHPFYRGTNTFTEIPLINTFPRMPVLWYRESTFLERDLYNFRVAEIARKTVRLRVLKEFSKNLSIWRAFHTFLAF